MTNVVIGIDGGGTMTRALCADLTGTVLAYVETGGANPEHNDDAKAQMHAAIQAVIAQAGRTFADVACLVAGIAGLNAPSDQGWAQQHTGVPGLSCPRIHLNDAEVAHAGAFGTGPGIIAVAGTGSVVFAITDTGQRLRNDDFHHYAGAARHLAFSTMQRVLLSEAGDVDAPFIDALLHYWGVADLAALREQVIGQRTQDYQATKRAYGGMAIVITDTAEHSPLARAACDDAVRGLATGVRLLGVGFAQQEVPVTLIGGLARSPAIRVPLEAMLQAQQEKRYRIVEPALPPVAGAILLALTHLGMTVGEEMTGLLLTTLITSHGISHTAVDGIV
jgi:glucosamine kinase